MRRVLALMSALVVATLGCQPTSAPIGESTAALASHPLGGTFMDVATLESSSFTDATIAPYMDELFNLGMTTVIIQSTMRRPALPSGCATHDCCDGTGFDWNLGLNPNQQNNLLSKIMHEAWLRNMEVYVGLVDSDAGNCWSVWNLTSPGALGWTTIDKTDTAAHDIYAALSADVLTFPNFKGWYIPDEPVHADWGWTDYMRRLRDKIRMVDGDFVNHKILVAPYLKGVQGNISPHDLAIQALAFKNATLIDVQVWQDGAGGYGNGAINMDSNNPQESTLEEWFTALRDTLDHTGLWADNELFTFADPYAGGSSGTSAAVMRLNRQLWETRDGIADKRVCWLEQNLMGQYPVQVYEAPRLMAAYRALYGIHGAYLSANKPYWWSPATPPAAPYLDTGGMLTDTVTGNPRLWNDGRWVGVVGDAELTIDVADPVSGGVQRIDWVGVDLLHYPIPTGIYLPTAMQIECSQNGLDYVVSLWQPRPRPVHDEDREYVFSNGAPLGISCRYLRIHLFNAPGAWTFLSEVEITQDSAL
jgi:Domain of unknown function (DUF4434)